MPQMKINEGGRFDFKYPYDENNPAPETSYINVANLQTTNQFIDKDINIKLLSGAVTVNASKQATAPTIVKTNTSATGAINVGSNDQTTTAPNNGYFVSVQATAPATTLNITKTINTIGFLKEDTQITASAATTSKTGSIYYIPITKGIAEANTSSASITIEETDDSSKGGKNIQSVLGDAVTSEPTSGYFLRIKANGSGSSKVTTAGWFPTGALATSSTSTTQFYPVTAASVTHSGGDISITNNYSDTPIVSATLTAQTTTGVELTTTKPSSGYYLTITSNSTALSGTTKATRAAYTETFSAGYLPAKTSTNILASSAVEPTVTVNAGSGISYITIPSASTLSFTGGGLTNKTASADMANNITWDTTTDNGIYVQTKGTAGRSAVTYTNTNAGWFAAHTTATSASGAVNSSTWNGTKYYITAINVPKDIGFSITTTEDTDLDPDSDLDITNAKYRRVDITNAANGTVLISKNAGNITSTQTAKSGTIKINAYETENASTVLGEQTIVENGTWKTTAASGASTYYGRVTVGSASTSLGGSTTTSGKATAAITNTNNINTITTLTNKTAGTDYWEIKATASITTTPKFTPSLTVSRAGWLATAPTGTATNVTVNGDTTGKSLYIPKATFTVSDNQVMVSTAGYIASGTVGTIPSRDIQISTTDPGTSYTNKTGLVLPQGGWLKLEAGYYSAQRISLATLVPDRIEDAAYGFAPASYILAGYGAFDANGVQIIGTLATYQGDYQYAT